MAGAFGRFDQRGNRRVFELGCGQPSANRFQRRGIAGRVRHFGQNAQIGGLALDVPVVLRKAKRRLGIVVEHQLEARFLAAMHGVAPRPACVETRAQRGHCRVGFGQPQSLLRKREAQEQTIHALLLFDERDDVGGAVLFEQPVAIGSDGVEIARVGGERCPEMQCRPGSPRRCAISPSNDSIHARTSGAASGSVESQRLSAAFARSPCR